MCEVLRVRRCFCFGSSVFNMPAWWQMLNAKQFHNIFLKGEKKATQWQNLDLYSISTAWFMVFMSLARWAEPSLTSWRGWDAIVQFRHIKWSINSLCRTHRAPCSIHQWIRCPCIFMHASVSIWRKLWFFYSWLFYMTDFYVSLV